MFCKRSEAEGLAVSNKLLTKLAQASMPRLSSKRKPEQLEGVVMHQAHSMLMERQNGESNSSQDRIMVREAMKLLRIDFSKRRKTVKRSVDAADNNLQNAKKMADTN